MGKTKIAKDSDAPETSQDDAQSKSPQDQEEAAAAGPPMLGNDGELDTTELEAMYDKIKNALNVQFNKRAIGVREVLGNLEELDPPSLEDALLQSLALAALGFASGGITTALAAGLEGAGSAAIVAAVQSGLDDGLKDAFGAVSGKIAEGSGDSKSTFFAAQEEGIESLRGAVLDQVVDEKALACKRVKGGPPVWQEMKLSAETDEAATYRAAVSALGDTARNIQYQQSLAQWMVGLARNEAGTDGFLGQNATGTDVGHLADVSPGDHYKQDGAQGVVYIAFGSRSGRPIRANDIKVGGLTSTARDQIKDVPIRDLGFPVLASGSLHDNSFGDALSVGLGDNEIAFGKNEGGTVFVRGHDDAMEALKWLTETSSAADGASIILDEDLGDLTLADARLES